ncbi:MAG: AbrB/MazE/SpoVT family DNA-binding domain-containing protein [Promethearchaeota archaeon]
MSESKPLSKVDKNGRITIPADYRERLGIKVGDYVEVSLDGTKIIVQPVRISPKTET